MASEDKTNTYDETVSRTTSEPTADVTVTEETAITTVPAGEVETYEVQSGTTTSEEESVSTKAKEAGTSAQRSYLLAWQKDKGSNRRKKRGNLKPNQSTLARKQMHKTFSTWVTTLKS